MSAGGGRAVKALLLSYEYVHTEKLLGEEREVFAGGTPRSCWTTTCIAVRRTATASTRPKVHVHTVTTPITSSTSSNYLLHHVPPLTISYSPLSGPVTRSSPASTSTP